ncbi:transcriptional regulator [Intrasporangium oryzae NRRL B-24470]|uniref:Transcriptional regulator n=1 Tax=Intrasporangium oryzae NRRL B-24470 TaxID=1386089 RepID=W9GFL3_9MICO|nr:MerR family transcriptional regulator [Intrasporangium oryzae]EWT03618.1 transcriptional regulator [Intrasporangium oryzae NRRL B-24470]
MTTWTVGRVADVFGVTVRTLHHYDEVGLLIPSERSRAGYRLYTDADLARLQQIVVYRRLELPLDEIAALLDGGEDAVDHLRRQRETVLTRLGELTELVAAIDRALEREMNEQPATPEEMKELFGDGFSDEYEAEAQERWGQTDAWKQSAARTKRYTKADWEAVKAEMESVNTALVMAKRAGLPPTSPEAMDAAEAHRRHIHDRFYELDHAFHRRLADMYVADPRFTKTYEDLEAGLAAYVRDAIHANADRHGDA